jgi:hypothetical protein
VKHVACAQFAFFNEFEGKKPPEDCEKGGHDSAKTKAELLLSISRIPSTTPTASSPRSRRTMRSTASKAVMPDRTPNWVSRSLRSGTTPAMSATETLHVRSTTAV